MWRGGRCSCRFAESADGDVEPNDALHQMSSGETVQRGIEDTTELFVFHFLDGVQGGCRKVGKCCPVVEVELTPQGLVEPIEAGSHVRTFRHLEGELLDLAELEHAVEVDGGCGDAALGGVGGGSADQKLAGVANAFPFIADLLGAAAGVVSAGASGWIGHFRAGWHIGLSEHLGVISRVFCFGDDVIVGRCGSDLDGCRLIGLFGQGVFGAADLDVEEDADGQDGQGAEDGDEQLSHD